MKSSISFVCQECGYESPAYLGKCPECGMWNSLKEFQTQSSNRRSQNHSSKLKNFENIVPKTLNSIVSEKKGRIKTGFLELDTVLGGGIVRGSAVLLAGDPGIGKSTLLLQLGLNLAAKNEKVLYISGEESEEQVKLRSERIMGAKKTSQDFLLISLNNTDTASEVIQQTQPSLVIIDSIQTMESEAAGGLSGSIGQVRFAAASFIRVAKTQNIPIIMVGHVTKEGMVAGPMMLSHMVDTVLFFEGEKTTNTRLLRSLKNRFGPVDEVGVFSMEEVGIREVTNPEHIFLSENKKGVIGSVLTVTMEGTRAFLMELQALVIFSKLPMPRRVASGVDQKRLELLLAVLQKYGRLPLDTMDVFINVAGGIKVTDRAIDLAVCLAIFSSLKNISLSNMVAASEVGLLGELRPVFSLEKRIKEAKKLGFKHILSSKTHKTLSEVIKSFGGYSN